MTVFSAIAAVLTLLVVAWVLRPLLRPPASAGVTSRRLNADIYRDQLQTLERDLARGAISPADHEATRDELQLRLLDDTESTGQPSPSPSPSLFTPRRMAVFIGLLFPLGSVGLYVWLGSPDAINPKPAQEVSRESVVQMVEKLAANLKAKPDNPQGWAMLARSYKVLGRFPEAEQAFISAGELVNTDADLLVDYADLLAVKAGGVIEGKPQELLDRALMLNPQHPMGLMMTGVVAYRRNDFAGAVTQWEKLLPLLEPGSPDAQQVELEIADARAKAGLPARAASGTAPAPNLAVAPDAGKLPPVDPAAAGAMTPDKINQMVERLAARLKANPDDALGWTRLARAYQVLGRQAEAQAATEQAAQAEARAKSAAAKPPKP
jgi:cytochrome c-type biogenesis protein CcmH